eukprot:5032840-Amphidinium_carterae.1
MSGVARWPGAAYGLDGVQKTDYGEPRLLALTVGDDSGRADVFEWYCRHLSSSDKGAFEQTLADWAATCEVLIKKTKIDIHDRCLEHTVGQGSYPEVQTMDMDMDRSRLLAMVGAKPVRWRTRRTQKLSQVAAVDKRQQVEDEECQRWILELW